MDRPVRQPAHITGKRERAPLRYAATSIVNQFLRPKKGGAGATGVLDVGNLRRRKMQISHYLMLGVAGYLEMQYQEG